MKRSKRIKFGGLVTVVFSVFLLLGVLTISIAKSERSCAEGYKKAFLRNKCVSKPGWICCVGTLDEDAIIAL